MHLTTKLGPLFSLAGRQYGLLSVGQMYGAGLDRTQIRRLVADGVIERIVRGLYRIAGSRTRLQDVAAAVSRHEAAVVSHVTALWMRDFAIGFAPRPHLTLPPGSTSRTSLGQLHRSHLDPIDIGHVSTLRVTTVSRSLVDAAGQIPIEKLDEFVSLAIADRRATVQSLALALDRVEQEPGRSGSGQMRSVLAGWADGLLPDSPAEAALLRRIVAFGLDTPVTQFDVYDLRGEHVARLDLAWPDRRVAREYDSDRYHQPGRAEADELRRQRLEALGWSVDVLHRGHLLPSREDWLHALSRDLQVRAA